jgi:hypothetical protein
MSRLLEQNLISLSDITAKEHSLIDLYQVDLHNYRTEKEQRAREIAEKLGTPSNRRSR